MVVFNETLPSNKVPDGPLFISPYFFGSFLSSCSTAWLGSGEVDVDWSSLNLSTFHLVQGFLAASLDSKSAQPYPRVLPASRFKVTSAAITLPIGSNSLLSHSSLMFQDDQRKGCSVLHLVFMAGVSSSSVLCLLAASGELEEEEEEEEEENKKKN